MDIKAFLNRKTEVDGTFKTEPVTVIVHNYDKKQRSLVQNILFRLEPTGRLNKLILLENPENREDVKSLLSEFVGFFTTRILTSTIASFPVTQLTENVVMFSDSQSGTTQISGLLPLLQPKKVLVLNTSFSQNKGKIILSNIEKHPFTGNCTLDNKALSEQLDNQGFNPRQYPLIESKLFNIFNQIITEGLSIEQTVETLDLETITSTNQFKFEKMGRVEKYFGVTNRNVYRGYSFEELTPFEHNLSELSNNDLDAMGVLSQGLVVNQLREVINKVQMLEGKINFANAILNESSVLKREAESHKNEIVALTNKMKVLEALLQLFSTAREQNTLLAPEDLSEIANMANTVYLN